MVTVSFLCLPVHDLLWWLVVLQSHERARRGETRTTLGLQAWNFSVWLEQNAGEEGIQVLNVEQ